MNKFLFATCFCLITVSGFAANQQTQQYRRKSPPQQVPVQPQQQVPMQQQTQPQIPAQPQQQMPMQKQMQPQQNPECAHLTSEEKAFAMQLSTIHRSVFCSQFTAIERAEAMTLVTESEQYGKKGTPLSPDMAVEKVIMHSRESKVTPEMKSMMTPKQKKMPAPPMQNHRKCGPMSRPGTGCN